MKKCGRIWAVVLLGIMGLVCGVISPAGAAPEALNIRSEVAGGQEPPVGPVLAGPRELSFPLPAVGRSLNLVARLGVTNAAWKLNLGRVASLTLVAGGGFILSTGDQCGRDTPDANIRAMLEAVEKYGRYS